MNCSLRIRQTHFQIQTDISSNPSVVYFYKPTMSIIDIHNDFALTTLGCVNYSFGEILSP